MLFGCILCRFIRHRRIINIIIIRAIDTAAQIPMMAPVVSGVEDVKGLVGGVCVAVIHSLGGDVVAAMGNNI